MFSEAVDEIAVRGGRASLRSQVVSYMNSTLRECMLRAYFDKDLVEDTVTAATDNYVWTPPRLMRAFRTVKYANGSFPERIQPGRKQINKIAYYYFATNYVVFNGTSAADILAIAYYTLNRRFLYYDSDSRPAKYDRDTESWTYLSGGGYVSDLGSVALNEAAQAKVHHWLLDGWLDLILEGTMAKLYKFLNDKEHQGTTFALYKSMQSDLEKTEPSMTRDR